MSSSIVLSLLVLHVLFPSILSSHIYHLTSNHTGVLHSSTSEDVPFRASAHLKRDVLCFEDLNLRILSCTNNIIRLSGRALDRTDFHHGVVLAISRRPYLAAHCPVPPLTPSSRDSAHQPVIFRFIRRVKLSNRSVHLSTSFLDPADVIDDIYYEFPSSTSSSARLSLQNPTNLTLPFTQRTNSVPIANKYGNGQLGPDNLGLNWAYHINSGLCAIHHSFRDKSLRLDFGLRHAIDIKAHFQKQVEWQNSGRAAEEDIIVYAGEFALGGIGLDFKVFVDYNVGLQGTASANMEAHSWYSIDSSIHLSLSSGHPAVSDSHGGHSKYSLTQSSDLGNSLSAEASIGGTASVSPGVGVAVDVAWVDVAEIELSAALGIEGQTIVRTTPFEPRAGVHTDVCKACHYGRGDFTTFARNLKLSYIFGNELFRKPSRVDQVLVNTLGEKTHYNCYWKSDCFATQMGLHEQLQSHSSCTA